MADSAEELTAKKVQNDGEGDRVQEEADEKAMQSPATSKDKIEAPTDVESKEDRDESNYHRRDADRQPAIDVAASVDAPIVCGKSVATEVKEKPKKEARDVAGSDEKEMCSKNVDSGSTILNKLAVDKVCTKQKDGKDDVKNPVSPSQTLGLPLEEEEKGKEDAPPRKSILLDMEPVSSDDDNLDMAEDVERRRKEGEKLVKKEPSTADEADAGSHEVTIKREVGDESEIASVSTYKTAGEELNPSVDLIQSDLVEDIDGEEKKGEDNSKKPAVEIKKEIVYDEDRDSDGSEVSEHVERDNGTSVVEAVTDADDKLKDQSADSEQLVGDDKLKDPVDGSEQLADDDKDSNEGEMSTLAILDVRTVLDEEKSVPSPPEKVDEQETMEVDKGSEQEKKRDCDVESKNRNSETDADMQSYAADTMNELLGLFGYDKVDDKDKDSLLSDNKVKDDKKEEKDAEKTPTAEADPAAEVKAARSELTPEKSDVTATKQAASVVGRQCSVCGKTKPCKYQVLMLGMTKFLCDDVCFKEFRTKQKISMASAATTASVKELAVLSQSQEASPNRPITRSITHPKDVCNQCAKEIRNGQGLLPGVGENKPLCSEVCMRAYQATQGLKRACAQCGGHILGRSRCLTWEAMEYCNEECLGKYQSYLGSHCAFCQQGVQQTSLGKYCVRFGSDIKQFCSNGCLEEFKKGLKICSYCQKDISTGSEGFLAPVGDKGQFKEFCSQACMEKFETMGNPTPIRPSIQQCSVCSKVTPVKVEVTFENKVHRLCSEPCIAAFRYANKINTSICDTCHKFFDLDVTRQLSIQFEGTCKRFCTKACTNVFVLHHRKVVPCSWCKVKKYNFDMIERVDSNNQVQLFCSLNCLSLFRVSLNATSSRRVQCDYCHQSKPAQYHLTMSDASIRNFCSYRCVMQFQSQFTTSTPAPPTPPVTMNSTDASPAQTTATEASDAAADLQASSADQSGTPVISSVMSLAPSQNLNQTSTTNRLIVPKPPNAMLLPVVSIEPHVPPKVVKAAQTQTLYPAISQHVIFKQPPVKMQKNKSISCKPMVQTKGVSCKPHPCHKSVQTDEHFEKQMFVPIPVPIYVPVPMHMYTAPVPFPIAFPVPIPVPIFIPTTKNSAQGIFRQIKEIQEKIPDNPFEADLILMAEMVAEDGPTPVTATPAVKENKRRTRSSRSEVALSITAESGGGTQSDSTVDAVVSEVSRGAFDDEVESQLRDSCQTSNSFGEDVLQMALQMASGMDGEPVDLEAALTTTTTSSNGGNESNSRDSVAATDENGSSFLASKADTKQPSTRSASQKRNRGGGGSRGGRGRKRARFEADAARAGSPTHDAERSANLPHPPPPYSYGVNAWKHWVLQKNTQLERGGGIGKGSGGSQSQRARRLKLFKTDLLQLTADELNYSLCLFVKEVRKPDGGEYAADSVYYLCLGIQQYLFENGRVDNIFADAYYEKFTECLNEVLINYEMALVSQGVFLSRIEEETLWDCKQLGAHSPHVLLNTLMYFNTKYFMLKTVQDHTQLSFSHILKHWKKGPGSSSSSAKAAAAAAAAAAVAAAAAAGGAAPSGTPGRSALLRYYPPSQVKDTSRRRKDVAPLYEQVENLDNPLRCPVKLYEFYLSKCPESIKNRSDAFYLYPERSCVPDSPVWYSTMSLGKETITKMLQRIKMVREVGETMMLLS